MVRETAHGVALITIVTLHAIVAIVPVLGDNDLYLHVDLFLKSSRRRNS